ncbi:MAG: FecR family protein [Mangrovibacterium sp.]
MTPEATSDKVKIAIVNYLSGEWEKCDSRLLTDWINESTDHQEQFRQLVDLWELDRLNRHEKDFNPDHAWIRLKSEMKPKASFMNRFTQFKQLRKYAAIMILTLVAGTVGYLLQKGIPKDPPSGVVEYTVPYGSKTHIRMPDGSGIWINAGSVIKYDQGFGNTNRNLQLSGEAYFEVAKKKDLPFVVRAKSISVKALGTKFNVKAYPEETNIETILLEGRVEVQDMKNKNEKILLKPNQKAGYSTIENNFSVSAIEDNSEISWYREKWIIRNMNMLQFTKLLERRYNIDFEFEDERIKTYEFGGTIKDETLEQVLTAITYSAPVNYSLKNKHVNLSIDESKLNEYDTLLK